MSRQSPRQSGTASQGQGINIFLRRVLWRICTRLKILLNIVKDKKALSFFLWLDLRLGTMKYGWFGHRSWETWMN